MDMIRAFGKDLDEAPLRAHLRREGAEQYLEPLRALAASGRTVTEKDIEQLWQRYYR